MITVKIDANSVIKGINNALDMTQNYASYFIEIIGKQNDTREWTLRGSILKAFSTKKSPADGGEKWKPLSKKYQEIKAEKYPGMPTLVATGTLFNSLVRANSNSVTIMTDKKLSYGTNLPYAKYLQMGTAKMPSRPFIGFNKKQTKALNVLLREYIKAAFQGKKEAEEAFKNDSKVSRT